MTSEEIVPAQAIELADLVDYVPGSLVSRIVRKSASGSLTVFAFDAGQDVSEHTTPCDAFVLILDGTAELTIGGQPITATAGQMVLMPGGVSHSLQARQRFKMLLAMYRG